METNTAKERVAARDAFNATFKERVTADVRHYCKRLGLTYNQTRAAINAALNKWGEAVIDDGHIDDDAIQCATSEGRHVAGQFAEANGDG